MKTPQELEEAFRKDLTELLEKHRASLTLDLRGRDYDHYEVMQVEIAYKYDENRDLISPGTIFDL